MINETYINANQQPAQGPLQTYGDEFDIFYRNNTSWRARGESLKGGGTAQVKSNHIFLDLLLDKPELEGEGEGAYAKISYARIWCRRSSSAVEQLPEKRALSV